MNNLTLHRTLIPTTRPCRKLEDQRNRPDLPMPPTQTTQLPSASPRLIAQAVLFIVACFALQSGSARASAEDTPPRPDTIEIHEKAAAFLQEGQPDESIRLLQELTKHGPLTAAADFLLATAHHDLGDEARAILHWRRALSKDPRLTEAASNIRQVASKLGIPQPLPPDDWRAHLTTIPRTRLVAATIATAWIVVIALIAAWCAKPPARNNLQIIAAGALILSLLTGAAVFAHTLWSVNDSNHAILIQTQDLLSAPASASEAVTPTLPAATPLLVIAQRGNWSYVRLWSAENRQTPEGWMPNSAWLTVRPDQIRTTAAP